MYSSRPIVMGIRRENEKKFEARVPLTPAHIQALRQQFPGAVEFLIQPSPMRTFTDAEFAQAGAIVQEDLSEADIILCVKEVYVDQLIDDKTYLVFAHVIKGQPDNMPVLQALLDRNITLIDYESITDHQGKRQVFFGHSAGQTGMFETLRALGQRLTTLGQPCIFNQLKPVYEYADLAAAKQHLSQISAQIQHDPTLLGVTEHPLVFGFAGLGNVGQGALDVFDLLPTEEVSPDRLANWFKTGSYPRGKVFKCLMGKSDLLRSSSQPADPFDAEDYNAHPDRYHSRLPELLPYLSVLLNCVFWSSRHPRILPKDGFRSAWLGGDRRLQVVGDLSCDPPAGSVACTVQAGDLYHPVFGYEPIEGKVVDAFAANAVTVMAVDNLSAGLPKDASIAFSTMLKAFIPALIHADFSQAELTTLPPELLRAVVTHQRSVAPHYRYLEPCLQSYFTPQSSQRGEPVIAI